MHAIVQGVFISGRAGNLSSYTVVQNHEVKVSDFPLTSWPVFIAYRRFHVHEVHKTPQYVYFVAQQHRTYREYLIERYIKEKCPFSYLKRHFDFLVGAEGVEPPTLCL